MSLCDWSSDVCSSDLLANGVAGRDDLDCEIRSPWPISLRNLSPRNILLANECNIRSAHGIRSTFNQRSEERRVGKECRTGGTPEHEDQKRTTTTKTMT